MGNQPKMTLVWTCI